MALMMFARMELSCALHNATSGLTLLLDLSGKPPSWDRDIGNEQN